MDLLPYQNFHLVGIKGVAMTAIAQLLIDAGKKVTGSDVEAEFVTQDILDQLKIKTGYRFSDDLPTDTECVIYTSAHQAVNNPQVQQALDRQLPTLTQAEAVAWFFNQQTGIAVCGVGGKSTTTAMVAWILEKLNRQPSFFVGVGDIPGLDRTGRWQPTGQYFVAEADEYVTNPQVGLAGPIIPKFSFLHPQLTICTNLKFDHPDVYQDLTHTHQIYDQFFAQLDPAGSLIVNHRDLVTISHLPAVQNAKFKILTFGQDADSTITLTQYRAAAGKTQSQFKLGAQTYHLELQIPGQFNVLNALAAILASYQLGIDPQQAADSLSSFRSTRRRFELVGTKNGVTYYDDYAHHPHEVAAAIQALNDWYPNQRKVIAFQSHTYSRTKKLFTEFVTAFQAAQQVVMINIFPSAREQADPTVSSDQLCEAIHRQFNIPAQNLRTIEKLAEFCHQQLQAGDVLLTLGAGDIYQVHSLIK